MDSISPSIDLALRVLRDTIPVSHLAPREMKPRLELTYLHPFDEDDVFKVYKIDKNEYLYMEFDCHTGEELLIIEQIPEKDLVKTLKGEGGIPDQPYDCLRVKTGAKTVMKINGKYYSD